MDRNVCCMFCVMPVAHKLYVLRHASCTQEICLTSFLLMVLLSSGHVILWSTHRGIQTGEFLCDFMDRNVCCMFCVMPVAHKSYAKPFSGQGMHSYGFTVTRSAMQPSSHPWPDFIFAIGFCWALVMTFHGRAMGVNKQGYRSPLATILVWPVFFLHSSKEI